MDEYLVVLCGIMLFGGQLDSDRLVSSFVSMVCKLSGTQLYVGECVCVCGGGGCYAFLALGSLPLVLQVVCS